MNHDLNSLKNRIDRIDAGWTTVAEFALVESRFGFH